MILTFLVSSFWMATFLVSYYISHLTRFARVSSQFADVNARNKTLMAKALQQGYR